METFLAYILLEDGVFERALKQYEGEISTAKWELLIPCVKEYAEQLLKSNAETSYRGYAAFLHNHPGLISDRLIRIAWARDNSEKNRGVEAKYIDNPSFWSKQQKLERWRLAAELKTPTDPEEDPRIGTSDDEPLVTVTIPYSRHKHRSSNEKDSVTPRDSSSESKHRSKDKADKRSARSTLRKSEVYNPLRRYLKEEKFYSPFRRKVFQALDLVPSVVMTGEFVIDPEVTNKAKPAKA